LSDDLVIAWATPAEAAAMAEAHAGAFQESWREEDFEDLLDGAGIYGFVARASAPVGVILCRVAAEEMEVLTIGVAEAARRRGVARGLMAAGLEAARQAGARACFLEVAVDNAEAVALYASLGFQRTGLRPRYYDRGGGNFVDAYVMRLDLNGAAP
jgi:ribosomal-protein-alanine N-acetyltransferase